MFWNKNNKDNLDVNIEVKFEYNPNNIASDIKSEDNDSSKWEVVHRKSDRWKELGFGDTVDTFPGYGRLFKREFEVWYCDIGSKEKKGFQSFQDRFPLHYCPKNIGQIVGKEINLEILSNSKGYEQLFSGVDQKNRKRWYFGVIKKVPLWIKPEAAIRPPG